MGKTTQRAFALSIAILFAVTTVGFSAFVIWQMYEEGKDSNNDVSADVQQQLDEQSQQPKDYMQDFEPLGTERVTELRVEDKTVGDGAEASESSTVSVQYTGALASDGSIFDSTDSRGGEPAEFALSEVIEGFKLGIVGMKAGGVRRIFIPAAQGYGPQGGGSIPADSDLVFDVTLVSVQ